jgi:hypothetical protein
MEAVRLLRYAVVGVPVISVVVLGWIVATDHARAQKSVKGDHILTVAAEFAKYPATIRAISARKAIVNWVASCQGVTNFRQLPESISQVLSTDETLDDDAPAVKTDAPYTLTAVQNEVIALSNTIYEQILAAGANERSANRLGERLQWATIAIGLFTTILASLNASDFFKEYPTFRRGIQMFAIVFPALGTAAGALGAFYNPHGHEVADGRTLSDLSLLDDQISLSVWKLRCDTDNDKVVYAWLKRYQQITNEGIGPSERDLEGSEEKPAQVAPLQTAVKK